MTFCIHVQFVDLQSCAIIMYPIVVLYLVLGPHRHPAKLVSDLVIFSRFFVLLVCFALDFGFIVHCLVVPVHSFLTEELLRCLLSDACFPAPSFFCLFLILPSVAP